MNHHRSGIASVYVLSALVALAIGAAIFGYMLSLAMKDRDTILESFQRAPIPGTLTVEAQPGDVVLYLEQASTDRQQPRMRPKTLTCVVVSRDTGDTLEALDLLAAESDADPSLFARGWAAPEESVADIPLYDTGEVIGYGSWLITLTQPTTLEVTTSMDASEQTPDLALAVGQDNLRVLLDELISGAVALTLGFTICVVILVIGYMKSAKTVTPRSDMPAPGDQA